MPLVGDYESFGENEPHTREKEEEEDFRIDDRRRNCALGQSANYRIRIIRFTSAFTRNALGVFRGRDKKIAEKSGPNFLPAIRRAHAYALRDPCNQFRLRRFRVGRVLYLGIRATRPEAEIARQLSF